MTSTSIRQEFLDRLQRQIDVYRSPLIEAAFRLEEKLLLSPYGDDLGGWQKDVAADADELRARIETHNARVGEYEHLLQEMQVLQGHPRELTRLEESNRKVAEVTGELLRLLDSQPTERTPSPLLRGLASFTGAMREHQAREVDVIYEIFWRDPVGGD
jgi:hypothetical protein